MAAILAVAHKTGAIKQLSTDIKMQFGKQDVVVGGKTYKMSNRAYLAASVASQGGGQATRAGLTNSQRNQLIDDWYTGKNSKYAGITRFKPMPQETVDKLVQKAMKS